MACSRKRLSHRPKVRLDPKAIGASHPANGLPRFGVSKYEITYLLTPKQELAAVDDGVHDVDVNGVADVDM